MTESRKHRCIDRLGSQPDKVLELVLSFLPSREAVATSGLARRWRHLWRSTPAVQLLQAHPRETSDDGFRLFVNRLLLHRAAAVSSPPLRSFEIDTTIAPPLDRGGSYDPDDDYDDELLQSRGLDPHVDLWIMHGVATCRARSLTARFAGKDGDGVMWVPRRPFAFASSRHLTTMRLYGVKLVEKGLLDFSSCPALLDLVLARCRLRGGASFKSPSLERLSILECQDEDYYHRVYRYPATTKKRRRGGRSKLVSTPNLRCLQISNVRDEKEEEEDEEEEEGSVSNDSDDGEIQTSLEGMPWWTPDGKMILPRDLTWFPTISKLKTSELNKQYDNVTTLARLLRKIPLLERLFLKLLCPTFKVKTEVSYVTLGESFLEGNGVVIKCRKIDAKVDEIWKLLSDFGISPSETSIN